jgi:hypothetical protein
MDRINKRAAISIALSVTIGLLVAYITQVGLALAIILPSLCFFQTRRSHAFFVTLGYYSAASSIVIPGAKTFFGPNTGFAVVIWLWIPASILLALPYAVLWSDCREAAFWRAPLAVLASVPPPLGIIGWANPLTSAGILFPGTAWFGLLLVLAFAALSPIRARKACCLLVFFALIANILYPGSPLPPAGWEGINTTFGGIGLESSSPLVEFSAAEAIQQRALQSGARVIIFPETVVPRWSLATELFWEKTLSKLARQGKTILVGAGINIPATRKHENAIIIRGTENHVFSQRIPVPFGMWQPVGSRGVPLHLNSAAVTTVARHRVAVLVCYEQFLTWPILQSLLFRPTVLLGLANLYWARETRIPQVQSDLLMVWSRLFGVAVISAVNI